eukprot:6452808-Amphidinium_carterae.1
MQKCLPQTGEDASAEHVEEVREALATSAAKQEFGPGGGAIESSQNLYGAPSRDDSNKKWIVDGMRCAGILMAKSIVITALSIPSKLIA